MDPAERLIDRCFAASDAVRYVAVYAGGDLRMRQRPDLADASASETDRFEELLVNPTLLTLARQRGEIDCGGLAYLLIRYGHFHTLVLPVRDGHVNVGFELDADLEGVVDSVRHLVAEWIASDVAARSSNQDRPRHGS